MCTCRVATASAALTAAHLLQFLSNVYGCDDEFIALQCSFVTFRLLMLYHDPEVCAFLDQYQMPPELYTTPWLVTLLARNLPTDHVLLLWDFLLVYNHPSVVLCMLLALVLEHRDVILATPVAELPGVMTSLNVHYKPQLTALCRRTLELFEATPVSFQALM